VTAPDQTPARFSKSDQRELAQDIAQSLDERPTTERHAVIAAAVLTSPWLATARAEAAADALDKVANSIDRMYAGSDGTMQDLAWIAGVDAAARKVRAFAGDYRSEVK